MLIEIATCGYDHGNPLRGYTAYSVWIDGQQVKEESIIFDYIPRGSNRLSPSYAEAEAIKAIIQDISRTHYELIFYGGGEIDPVKIASQTKRSGGSRFQSYFIPSPRYKKFINDASRARTIRWSTRGYPAHVEEFVKRHSDWIYRRHPQSSPKIIRVVAVLGGYV